MAADRAKITGRGGRSGYLALPHVLLNHPNYVSLPVHAKQLLIDVAAAYKGHNNGDLACTLRLMKNRGWTSNATLRKHLAVLLERGFLVKTRQGGRNQCSLYAITWKNIDYCNAKHDYPETKEPLGWWKTGPKN